MKIAIFDIMRTRGGDSGTGLAWYLRNAAESLFAFPYNFISGSFSLTVFFNNFINFIKPHKIWCDYSAFYMRNASNLIISLISQTEWNLHAIWSDDFRLATTCGERSGFRVIIAHAPTLYLPFFHFSRRTEIFNYASKSDSGTLIMRWRAKLLVFINYNHV